MRASQVIDQSQGNRKRSALAAVLFLVAGQALARAETSYALLAPAQTPAPRIEALNSAVRRAPATDQLRSRLTASGADPAASTPEELAALIRSDTAKWEKLIREKKINGE